MPSPPTSSSAAPKSSARFYERFLEQREEILRHKWIESQKAGEDIGFERALTEWMSRHRDAWLAEKKARKG